MNAHTPGPWSMRLNHFSRWEILDARGVLASISKHDDPASPPPITETEANARLIAAAPDLLAVVEALVVGRDQMDGRLLVDENSPLIDAAREALEKVRA